MTTTAAAPPEDEEASPPFRMGGVGRHTLVYGTGIFMSKALAFLMLPIYTRYLTPTDYGIVGLIEITLDVIAILGGSQLLVGIFRFYHKADTERRRREVVATALLTLAASYVTVGICVILAAPLISRVVFHGPEHVDLIRLAGASLGCQAFLIVPLAYARVKERSKLYVTASAIKLVLAASLNVLFIVHWRMGPAGVFSSGLITSAVVGAGLTIWLARTVGLHPSREAARDLVRYGLPLVATQFATFIATFGDRYFLERTAGTAEVGIYNLAYQFGFLLAVVGYVPFDQVWGPKRFQIAQRADSDELLARGFIYGNLLLLTTAVGIVLFVRPMLQVMSDPAFHGAARLVPVILIAYVFQSWAKAQDIGILVKERTGYLTLANWIAALTALAAYALLVPRWYGWGAAIGTALAFGVRYVLTFRFSQKLWRVEYRWGPVLRLLGIGVAVSAVALALPSMELAADLAVRCVLLAIYFTGMWNARVLSDAERAKIAMIARRMGTNAGAWVARRRWPLSARTNEAP